ncbi:hypothetical protein OnM2_047062 [Erysiphe neolycopersici]|uniref:Uncharacterized protein n=1 Tax=Erysiphe neolycopersici TaxID=212602 RepID=A0A420HTP4_9PEZI|nr:hypothetical protein OnM2_047062 [Erysiphe neolycopersici]
MAKFLSFFLRPYSIATICSIVINTRHVAHMSPNKSESFFFSSPDRIAHRDNSDPVQSKRVNKFQLDVKTIRQITSGSISGFGVSRLLSKISRPLLIITVLMGVVIQKSSHT